jgi:putative transposase
MSNNLVENVKSQNLALKLKLSPTQEQKSFLDRTFGCARFIYNFYLNEKNQFYEKEIKPLGNDKKARNAVWKTFEETPLKDLKIKYPWLKEANQQGICNAYMNLKGAYQKFYKGLSELPKFHSKKNKNSFKDSMMKENFFNWNEKTVDLPKIGKIKFQHRNLPTWYKNRIKVCSYTCSRNSNGKYYITILFEVNLSFKQKSKSENIDENQIIGLDFDCDDMYIDSNGKSALKDFGFKKQKQKNLPKLSHLQRQYARTIKGSKNREKLRIKLASLEEHIANTRLDWIEKETLRLTKENQLIGLEDLSIQGMMKGSKNAKNYQDISWSTFVTKLQWKGEKNGCHVIKIDRFFPSSQTCNCCGFKNKEVRIKHLEKWTCPKCGKEHQRDENAAKNIAVESYKVLREAEENQEKSCKSDLSKDTDSVLSVEELANLVLSCAQ